MPLVAGANAAASANEANFKVKFTPRSKCFVLQRARSLFFSFLLPLNVELPLSLLLPSALLHAAYCAPLSKALCMRHTQLLLLLLLLYKRKRTKTFAAGWAAHSAGHKNADSSK